jgi:cytochrome P450
MVLEAFELAFSQDPHGALREARSHGWWIETPLGVMVLDHGHAQALARDPRLRSYGTVPIEFQGVTDGPLYEWWRRAPLHIDGDDHARIRRLVARAFTPRSIDALRPRIREITESILARLDPASEVDFVAAFADELPVRVICDLLGVPDNDVANFAAWARSLGLAFGIEIAQHRDEIEAAVVGLYAYVDGLLEERRRSPGDDLVSLLVQVEEEGERLSHDELLALIVALLFAGHDTTRNQLGCAMVTFADHPAEWERVRSDPALVPTAVEEILRFEPAVGGTARIVDEAFTVDGLDLPEGILVSLSALAANRDPAVFADPDRFDVGRRGEPPVTFGGGVHYCLGAALARAELQEALPLLTRHWRTFTISGEVPWRTGSGIRGPQRVVLAPA